MATLIYQSFTLEESEKEKTKPFHLKSHKTIVIPPPSGIITSPSNPITIAQQDSLLVFKAEASITSDSLPCSYKLEQPSQSQYVLDNRKAYVIVNYSSEQVYIFDLPESIVAYLCDGQP